MRQPLIRAFAYVSSVQFYQFFGAISQDLRLRVHHVTREGVVNVLIPTRSRQSLPRGKSSADAWALKRQTIGNS
jgi:hypothetical protein